MKENIALSVEEQRQAKRHAPLQNHKGRLSLSISGQPERHNILTLRDVSPFGIGIESNLLIEKGDHVQLVYEEATLALAISGTVAWYKQASPISTKATNPKHYQVGIELCPANVLKNIHFFRHLTGIQ